MTHSRTELVDALRVLALLGVFVVNVVAYPEGPWGGPVSPANPANSPAAMVASGIIAGLFQNKAYPLLAFLFGYSLALSLRTRPDQSLEKRVQQAQRRQNYLLLLGLAHGFLIYFGDILTAYAVSGLLLLSIYRWKLKRLKNLLIFPAVVWLLTILFGLFMRDTPAHPLENYASTAGWGDQLVLNMQAYLATLFALPFYFLPEIFVLMSSGVIAGRLRLLERPSRYKRIFHKIALWTLPIGLVLNFIYGLTTVMVHIKNLPYQYALYSAATLIGPVLTVGIVSWISASSATAKSLAMRVVKNIAPAGRNTLSMYIGLSVVMMIFLSGAGAGWAKQVGTYELFLGALALYAMAAVSSYLLTRHRVRGPLESWLHQSRKT